LNKKKGKYITGELKEFIVAQYAAFESAPAIQTMVQERFEIIVPVSSIRKVKSRDKALVDEARERLRKQLDKIPLANAYWRLLERQKLINDLKKNGLWDKDENGKDTNNGRHLLINKILDSAAEEFKQVLNINVDTDAINVLNMNIDDFMKHLDKEKASEIVGQKLITEENNE